jgi:hypothetical protein
MQALSNVVIVSSAKDGRVPPTRHLPASYFGIKSDDLGAQFSLRVNETLLYIKAIEGNTVTFTTDRREGMIYFDYPQAMADRRRIQAILGVDPGSPCWVCPVLHHLSLYGFSPGYWFGEGRQRCHVAPKLTPTTTTHPNNEEPDDAKSQ